jgi:MFS transporter, ACS family, glucarate transporter
MPQTFRVSLRNRVLLLVALASGITYLDRVCLSAAAPAIMRDLRLSSIQMGYAFSVFSLAYGIFEIPTGWLGDRWGQRKMITRIVACWSVFTALTGMARGYLGLMAVRFAFGAAEAGAFPSMAAALARWFKITDRARATGIMWMGTRIGAAVGIPLATLLIGWFGWRCTFAIFGAIGGMWCIYFWRWYRDDPALHPAIDPSDLCYLGQNAGMPSAPGTARMPWRRLFTSANLWAFFWMYFATSYGFWFLLTWLPTYLIQRYRVTAQIAGFYAALPLAAGAASNVIGGTLSDWVVLRTGSQLWGRRVVGFGGFLIAGAGFTAAGVMQRPQGAVLCLMLADFGMDLAVPVAWASCLEVGGSFAGTVTAFMNTGSTISAFISPLAAAWMLTRFGSFQVMLMSAGAVYFIASLLWLKIDPRRSLMPDKETGIV